MVGHLVGGRLTEPVQPRTPWVLSAKLVGYVTGEAYHTSSWESLGYSLFPLCNCSFRAAHAKKEDSVSLST